MPYRSDRRLYRTADDRIVEEGDPDAAFLLVGAGGELDDATAARYGLTADPAEPTGKPAPANKAKAPAGAKAPVDPKAPAAEPKPKE